MKTIGELLTRDLSRKIEEIIQVDQADEQSVHAEITEYIATDSIREQYHHLLKAIPDAHCCTGATLPAIIGGSYAVLPW